ncbi:MAG: hypothetical protein ACKOA8_07070, partial [Deltaproteobacteria bacterium]
KSHKPLKKTATKPCSQAKCKSIAESSGYCRLHYLANWKRIKLNNQLKAEARLNHFVDKLAKKYPDSYIEKIKEGVENEERFLEITKELDIESKESIKETDSEFLERFLRVVKPGS